MSDVVHFEGTMSPEIFMKAQWLSARRRFAVILVLAFAAIIYGALSWRSDDLKIGSLAMIAGGATLLISIALRPVRWRRLYEKSPYLRESIRGTVSPASYSVKTAVGSAELPWSKFIKAVADDDMVLLYRGPHVFNILSREYFASAEDWQKARSIVLEMAGQS